MGVYFFSEEKIYIIMNYPPVLLNRLIKFWIVSTSMAQKFISFNLLNIMYFGGHF